MIKCGKKIVLLDEIHLGQSKFDLSYIKYLILQMSEIFLRDKSNGERVFDVMS